MSAAAPTTPSIPAPVVIGSWLGLGCAVGAALLFAGKAVLVRLAYAAGGEPTSLLGLRMLAALPCFVLIAVWYHRRDGALSHRDTAALALLGILGYHVASWLDFAGLQRVDAALERVLLFVYPTMVTLWAVLRRHRGADRRLVLTLLATYGGILLTWGDRIRHPGGHADVVGVLLIIAAAAAFAAHLVMIDGLVKRLGGIRCMAVAMVAACITCVLHAVMTHPAELWHPTKAVVGYAVALGVFATVIPVLLAAIALQHLGAARAAIAGSVAPVVTALLAWLLAGEHLGVLGWLGCATTMVGAIVAAAPRR